MTRVNAVILTIGTLLSIGAGAAVFIAGVINVLTFTYLSFAVATLLFGDTAIALALYAAVNIAQFALMARMGV